jgi:elongation factor Ts
MEISARLVKELRDKTGAGMMDCKRSLIETDGDLSAAEELLRKKGFIDAARKASRVAADGLISVSVSADGKSASIIELNSETDFVARNEKFQEMAEKVAKVALGGGSVHQIASTTLPGSDKSVADEIGSLISVVGENINLRRAECLHVKNGVVVQYIHGQVRDGMGKIGVLVVLEADGDFDKQKTFELGKKLAMHVAAANPLYLNEKSVPAEVVNKEREIFLEQANNSGKSPEIAAKMAEGRIRKFYEEVSLCDQIFVIDGKTKIKDAVEEFNKNAGCKVYISRFIKFVLGEGVEKNDTNFADEVRSLS